MRFFIALCLSLGLITTSAFAQNFPSFVSQDLNGDTHSLPADFPGDPTIVFIAYKRDQQPDVDSWVSALNLDPDIGPEFVELPVVGSLTRLISPVVDNGMRSGIVNTSLRARTITLYENASKVNTPLGFDGRDDIRVLLVRPTGEVIWKTSGPATSQGVDDLKAIYAQSLKKP
ncbi:MULTISPECIES: hypothetical protein [Pacificibacter]|uniref:hypothetical protein n=1 Tax=Pacificibacter TaxID=1042323 RepID=UPI001C0A036A|nr:MULTISPECIES: hypothetical protein [Pacificibacter]MBU2937215.1 hypothetical protein [Pacificibacter marinus]MDO6615210.1 hypothetical protein [Pacificibacter sp. 1_MG-2023]